ncbi:hypothetical protein B296_00033599 [Ensete ventricosum]|uniref:TLC domain-containing protein n=1 Tax=Ensete ventricosum TaxID=4639 RepID=A0A426Y642_ENSVE|nr:hypothetical protein B296_00033599 [Ensete ventricosum]
MQVSKLQVMAEKSYIYQAEWLVRNYLLADHLVAYTSVLVGIYMCKMVSVGYFVSDLAMIFWLYPSLGGIEYVSTISEVLHHLLSATAISYAMLSGEGQLYTYMVLISEATTPGINLRWYFINTIGLYIIVTLRSQISYTNNGLIFFFLKVP